MGDLVNLVTVFKQPTGGFVPTIMEMEVLNPQDLAGASERCLDASRIIGKDVLASPLLSLDDRPGLRGALEPTMIAFLLARMFGVANDPAT